MGRGRKTNDEKPDLSGMPERPDFLNDIGIAQWGRLCRELERVGRLQPEYRDVIALTCVAWQDWHQASGIVAKEGMTVTGSTGQTVKHPAVIARDDAWRRVMSGLVELRLTPKRIRAVDQQAAEKAAASKKPGGLSKYRLVGTE